MPTKVFFVSAYYAIREQKTMHKGTSDGTVFLFINRYKNLRGNRGRSHIYIYLIYFVLLFFCVREKSVFAVVYRDL